MIIPLHTYSLTGNGCYQLVYLIIKELKNSYDLLKIGVLSLHSGSEGTDSLSRESDQKLAALYCKTNRKLPFLKAAKGCFENSMK